MAYNTTCGTVTTLLIIRGAALGWALRPTQLIAFAVVPPRLLANASSLKNAMRNVIEPGVG